MFNSLQWYLSDMWTFFVRPTSRGVRTSSLCIIIVVLLFNQNISMLRIFPLLCICLHFGYEECYCSIYSSYSSRHLSSVIFVCSSQVFEVVAQLFRPRITCEFFHHFSSSALPKTAEPPRRFIAWHLRVFFSVDNITIVRLTSIVN